MKGAKPSAPRTSLNDFSPEEWRVIALASEERKRGGADPKGSGPAAAYCAQPPPSPRLVKDERGVTAVEFALVAPMFMALFMGIAAYGGWFWLSHSVQLLAADSARAALAGVTPAEQASLAQGYVAEAAGRVGGLNPALATTSIETGQQSLTVRIRYDAHQHPLVLLAGPLPHPPGMIERTAVVRLGGY